MISGLGFPMALQFKPDGSGGWLYRKDQTGAPLPATTAERDSYVRWYGWIMLGGFVLYFAEVAVLAAISNAIEPDPSNAKGVLGAAVMMTFAFAGLYIYLKWFSHAPARAFADRAPVGPAQTQKQVHGRRLRGLTWRRLATTTATMLVVMVAAAFQPGIAPADRSLAIAICVIIPLAVGLGFAIWKWRIDNEAA